LYEVLKGKESIVCSDLFLDIGSSYKFMNKLTEAREYFNKALILKGRIYGTDSINYANVLNDIGLICNNQYKQN
jgi:hypothetical protein